MNTIYILDVPENIPVVEVASKEERVTTGKIGPYFQISSEGDIVVDRRATGCRHAVWYSCVAGVSGGRVIQHDKNALRVSTTPTRT